MNEVTVISKDILEISDRRFQVFKEVREYNKDHMPLYNYFIECAYAWNMSNRIRITARGLKSLVHKIEAEQYRIVKG